MFTKVPFMAAGEGPVTSTTTAAATAPAAATATASPRDAMDVEDTTSMTPAEKASVMPLPAPEKEHRVSASLSPCLSNRDGSDIDEPASVTVPPLCLRSGIAYKLPVLTKPALPKNKKGRGVRKGKNPEGTAGPGPAPRAPAPGIRGRPGAQPGYHPSRAGATQDRTSFQDTNSPGQGDGEKEVGRGPPSGGHLQGSGTCKEFTGEPKLPTQKGQALGWGGAQLRSDYGPGPTPYGVGKGQGRQNDHSCRVNHFVAPEPFVAGNGNFGFRKNYLPGSYTMTSTPMINNSTRAFPLPHLSQTNNLNEASDSASSTMDDWMRNVNDIQSLLMNKNEMLQQEINKLSSHQKEDRMRLDKTSATVERSSAHIMDIKHITQSIETRAMNTGDDVEKLHSSIHACKKVIDTCVKMNHQEARDVSNIMEAINTMNSEPTRQWDVVTALFGDIQQQMNTLTASFNEMKVDKTKSTEHVPAGSGPIEKNGTPEQRETPPHMLKDEKSYSSTVNEKKLTETSEHTPSIIDMPNHQPNFKNFPKASAYPTYSGKPEEDWVRFIEDIDILKNAYALPDSEIVSKLPSLLMGIAYTWYRIAGRENTAVCWETWKQLIGHRFGDAQWRQKQLELLDSDKFTYEVSDVSEYLMNMHRRIESIYPGLKNDDMRMHILMRLPSDLRNLITPHPSADMEMSRFLALCAQIITGTKEFQAAQRRDKLGHNTKRREWKNKEDRAPYNKNYKGAEVKIPLAGDYQERKPKGTCNKCGKPWSPGHYCRKNDINVINEDNFSVMDDSHSDLALNSQGEEEDDDQSINMLEQLEYEVLTSSNFKEDAEGRLLNVQDAELMHDPQDPLIKKHCPAKCTVLINDQETVAVLDTGAGGCVVSSKYLASKDKNWESHMLQGTLGVWSGYGSTLKPIGTYTSGVIFGHERGNTRCAINFTVMEGDNLPQYFIIGNNALHLYGIKLHISEGYFTIGKNTKRHFELSSCHSDTRISMVSEDIGQSIPAAQTPTPVGAQTPEPEEFEKAFKTASYSGTLAYHDRIEGHPLKSYVDSIPWSLPMGHDNWGMSLLWSLTSN